MHILAVAEKPSVARELANIIGKGRATKRNGHSRYNHVFDMDCMFQGRQYSLHMTSVLGHLMTSEFDAKYKSWNGCNPEDLFSAPIKKEVPATNSDLVKTLQQEARRCNILFLWLDCDLEGENIAYEVINVCKEVNPRLDIYRARFSSLIPRDIDRAMMNPDRPNPLMNDAVEARQEIDLRLGAAFTRFQTLRIQNRFAVKVSYGPCQFPTLGFVVDRYMRIQNFKQEEYWNIECELNTPDPDELSGTLTTRFSWRRGNLFDRYITSVLFELITESGEATVTDVTEKRTTRHRPCPLNTVELQKRASRYLHLSSEQAMKAAESLYQRGIISYPRTETDFFKEGFELIQFITEHANHPEWGNFAADLVQRNKFVWPSNGGHDDKAHPPIHPTKCLRLDEIPDAAERNIYELVTRHFLACCANDGIGSQTTITITFISPLSPPEHGYGETFTATGIMIQERNWLDVYRKWEKWTGNKVAQLNIGDRITPTRLAISTGVTHPPLPLSESDLISEMDSNGIGTDATIAQHITTIQERKYAVKNEDNRFIPTPLGIALVEGYNSMGYQLNKPYLRASMERDCQRISRGELRKADMIKNCLQQMKECFVECVREVELLDAAIMKHFEGQNIENNDNVTRLGELSICGACDTSMDLVENATGIRSLQCTMCAHTLRLPLKCDITVLNHRCPICNFQILNVRKIDHDKSYTLCPHCFNHPPGPPLAEANAVEFRCFSCAHTTCPYALRVSSMPFAPCFLCSGKMSVKKTEKGIVAGCSEYPRCKASWWLPKSILNVSVCEDLCPNNCGCQLLKLSVSVSQGALGVRPEEVACPVCSGIWHLLQCAPLTRRRINTASTGIAAVARNAVQDDLGSVAVSAVSGSDYGSALKGRFVRDNNENKTCKCGLAVVLRTVSKVGPNTGRNYYSCSKDRMDGCNFFEWADGETSTTSGTSYKKKVAPIPSGSLGSAEVVCTRCKCKGHYARSCPNRK